MVRCNSREGTDRSEDKQRSAGKELQLRPWAQPAAQRPGYLGYQVSAECAQPHYTPFNNVLARGYYQLNDPNGLSISLRCGHGAPHMGDLMNTSVFPAVQEAEAHDQGIQCKDVHSQVSTPGLQTRLMIPWVPT